MAAEIRDSLSEMFPNLVSVTQVISGAWKYFRDFRDDILDEKGS
jgi:hypothetical protein